MNMLFIVIEQRILIFSGFLLNKDTEPIPREQTKIGSESVVANLLNHQQRVRKG
jgi:hypothetical protein